MVKMQKLIVFCQVFSHIYFFFKGSAIQCLEYASGMEIFQRIE